MGKGIFVNRINDYRVFKGTTLLDKCMYHVKRLESLPLKPKRVYIETKNSGGCFFSNPAFVVGYAVPGTAPGRYNFMFGWSFQTDLRANPPWQRDVREFAGWKLFMWTLPNGVRAVSEEIRDGRQLSIKWTVLQPAVDAGGASLPNDAFQLDIPVAGSDERGEPKLVTQES